MSSWRKGAGILSGCLMAIMGVVITIVSFIGLVVFPGFGFSIFMVILGIVFTILGLVNSWKASNYIDWSNSPVKSESEVDENTSFDEMQEIIKRRGWK